MPPGRAFRDSALAGRLRCLAAVAAIAAVAAAVGVSAAALEFAAPGSAAPYVTAPALAVSTTAPCKGAPLTVTGTDFVPGSTVTLTLHPSGHSLGSVVVGADGGFTATVTVPKITGTRQLVAAGPPTRRNTNTAEATLHIQSCVGPVPITGYSGGPAGGGFALPAGLAALACLMLGGVLAWRRRRRRHAA